MTLNIETDIDLNIQKANELLEKLKMIENNSQMLRFITIKEFAEIRGASLRDL